LGACSRPRQQAQIGAWTAAASSDDENSACQATTWLVLERQRELPQTPILLPLQACVLCLLSLFFLSLSHKNKWIARAICVLFE
jgi:hypothetical protein